MLILWFTGAFSCTGKGRPINIYVAGSAVKRAL